MAITLYLILGKQAGEMTSRMHLGGRAITLREALSGLIMGFASPHHTRDGMLG